MKVAIRAALAVAILGLVVASPLPTTTTLIVRDDASTPDLAPTSKPTLPAVAVLADEQPWTYTVFNVYWPQEHVDARNAWYPARSGVLAMWICLIPGVPIALISWAAAIGFCWFGYENLKSRRRVRAMLTNKRKAQATQADDATKDSPAVETHELDAAQRIKFSDPERIQGSEDGTPMLPNQANANVASDPQAGTGRRRGGIRGLFVGAMLLFSPRAKGAPLLDFTPGLSLADTAVAEPPTLAPAIARAGGIVAFAAESTATVASAVHARDIPPDVTLTAPKTEETKCKYKACQYVDSAKQVLVWTTYQGAAPAETVIVATSVTVGGNIVPWAGWSMQKTADKQAYLRMQEYILIPLVYGPAALGVLVFVVWKLIN